MCSLSPPRSYDGSLPDLVGVCRWTSHLPLRGSFSKRSLGRRVNGSLSLSLYRRQPHATQLQKVPFALWAQPQSLIRCLLLLHLNGICRWTSQLLLRGSFSKRSTGQRVTFTFTILYMIAHDARLTPPRCKKRMAYDDARLKHTAAKSIQHLLLARRLNFLVMERENGYFENIVLLR